MVERSLGPFRRVPARDAAVLRDDRERHVAVADEDDRRSGQPECSLGCLLAENVLPDGIARARVVEVDAIGMLLRRESRQELPRPAVDHLGGPGARGGRVGIEVADQHDAPDREQVVVAR